MPSRNTARPPIRAGRNIMKQLEKVKAIISYATAKYEEALKNYDREALNICGSVRLCGDSLIDSFNMVARDTDSFFHGVVMGKAHFFEQLAILMAYHFGETDIACFRVGSLELLNEAKGAE